MGYGQPQETQAGNRRLCEPTLNYEGVKAYMNRVLLVNVVASPDARRDKMDPKVRLANDFNHLAQIF
jgi:hypothetical protein